MIKRYDYVPEGMYVCSYGNYVEHDEHAAEVAKLTSIISGQELKISNLRARLLAIGRDYEELRSIIDGGSESMTHADAVELVTSWEAAN